ncbi:MAG TPA: hypothetical protein ENJ64_01490 [Thiotrichales bacterium]|nr:hypothetical protein [Thiotrichales bacterium]
MTEQTAKKTGRRKTPLILIGLVLIAFILLNRQEPVKTVECNSEVLRQNPDVIMLGAWWCTYCYQAKKYFQKNNIHYCEYDMENTEAGKRLYEENGGGAVPLMLIGKYRLHGFNPDVINEAILRASQEKNIVPAETLSP